jgi:murein L,D-transpeptidase YafK
MTFTTEIKNPGLAFVNMTVRNIAMKNTILLLSVFLGSSLLASNAPYSDFSLHRANKRFNAGSEGPVGTVYIIIDKSNYELTVYDEKGWYATYPVVFGNNSLEDKKMEGDRNTPEGTFHITCKKIHDKWDRFMALDYPNKESREKFNQRKERGEIPLSARIGGGIGIHGTWPHEDFVIDRTKNWTLGCISMKRPDVEEVYDFTPVGTKVIIRK